MHDGPKIIRCKKCKRVFSNYADHCPECGTKTSRGWMGLIIPILCVLIALAVLVWTIYALSNRPEEM